MYQLVVNTLRLAALLLGYFVLKSGAPAYYLYYAYISVSVVVFFVSLSILHKTLNFDNKILWKQSYLPSLAVTILFLPCCFLLESVSPLYRIIIALLYIALLVLIVGLSKSERSYIFDSVKKIISAKFLTKNNQI